MRLYKGAGPGTYWNQNDARLTGFHVDRTLVVNNSAVIRHVAFSSFPSPLLSFSTSYAIALAYSLAGPWGKVSTSKPGLVYEIDTDLAPVTIYNPIAEIVDGSFVHTHDGDPSLILGIASFALHGHILQQAVKRLSCLPRPPKVSDELCGLVFSIRDAEILTGIVPKACVLNVHRITAP
ncbi:hypothetical protein [Chromobacterium subtsugae]|uniref:hypothetical protein n=1 Tax=Chromobacterium subtsugae TaxID=251747 RepID=UPI0012D378CB|nr:hypothetical protein [Chromobacterium subtsugae]